MPEVAPGDTDDAGGGTEGHAVTPGIGRVMQGDTR